MKKQIFTTILLLMGGVATFGQFRFDGGTNSLRLQTNGIDRLFIAPNSATAPVLPGNVGIGTFAPPAKLTVVGDFALRKIQRETSSGGFNDYDRQDASIAIFENGGTLGGIAGGSEGQMLYVVSGYGNAQSALIIRHDSPSNPTAANRILTHTGADFTISSGLGGVLLIYDATKARWRIVETPSGSGSVAGWGLTGNAGTNPATQFIGTTDAQPLAFKTNNVEAMRVLSTGNVGIGTPTPDAKLHIWKGNAGSVTPNSNTVATFESSGFGFLSVLTPATSNGGIVFGSPTSNARGYLIYNHTTDKMLIGTVGSEKITIDGTGKVGIGTTTPDAKLDVLGDVRYAPTNLAPSANSTLDPLNRNNMSYISINATAGVTTTINGISAPSTPGSSYGTMVYISAGPGATVILKNNAAAVPANTIYTQSGSDVTINSRGGLILIYDVDGWRLVSGAL